MPRRNKKYDKARERYGLEVIKGFRDIFGRKPVRFDKVEKYFSEIEKEQKFISNIEVNIMRGTKVTDFVKRVHMSRPKYYRLYNKYKKQILSIRH